MTSAERAALWSAIHQYVGACGGDLTDMTLGLLRMDAEKQIERAFSQLVTSSELQRFFDQADGMAKREYPAGRMGATDDGAAAYAVGVSEKHRSVVLRFSSPILWVGLGVEQADELCKHLADGVRRLRGQAPSDDGRPESDDRLVAELGIAPAEGQMQNIPKPKFIDSGDSAPTTHPVRPDREATAEGD